MVGINAHLLNIMDNISKNQVMALMQCDMKDFSIEKESMQAVFKEGIDLDIKDNALYDAQKALGCWDYWQDHYYPRVIRESYPVYIQERAKDKGKQAFEIIKVLKDKKLVNLAKVVDFIDLMDELIKIL